MAAGHLHIHREAIDVHSYFRLPRMASFNTAGPKYGLVYPGVGWVVWRNAEALPDALIFKVNYLGGEMPALALKATACRYLEKVIGVLVAQARTCARPSSGWSMRAGRR